MTKAGLFRRWRRLRVSLIPCMIAAAVCLPALFGEKWTSDTGLYSAISLKAVREGHWWTLWLTSGPYFNKPPLMFWMHAAALKLFGVHDWSLKLPEYLAVLGCVLLTVKIARLWSPPRVAMLAGIILACTPQFVLLVDSFRLDYPHTLWLLAAVWLVGKGVKRFDVGRSAAWWIVASGAPIGCALMTKPLWGLSVYGVLAAWLMVVGGERRRLIPWLLGGAAVAVAVALPWHVSMRLIHGEAFWRMYFERQIVERAAGNIGPQAGWHWYLKFLSETYWPWLPFVGLAAAWSLIGRPSMARDKAGTRLAWVWVVAMLVMVSAFSGKNRYYIFHLYPMMAWLAAMTFGHMLKPSWRRVMDHGVLVPAAVGLGAAAMINAKWEALGEHLAVDVLSRQEMDIAMVCVSVMVCLGAWRWYRVIERRALGVIAGVVLAAAVVMVPGSERQTHRLRGPWPSLHRWVREEVGSGRVPAERLYNGSLQYNMNARVYVKTGVWPIVSGWNNSPPAQPEKKEGAAWIVFDLGNGQQKNRPRKRDVEVFRAGEIVVVKRGGKASESVEEHVR